DLPVGRQAKLTAIRVLQAVGSDSARAVLRDATSLAKGKHPYQSVHRQATDALAQLGEADAVAARASRDRRAREVLVMLAADPDQDGRSGAARELGGLGAAIAVPRLRTASLEDGARAVRETATYSLAILGDVQMVTPWMELLDDPEADSEAKIALRALGYLAD